MTNEEGRKLDAEKIQVELLSPSWLLGVGQVLTFGARKYEAHNWRKGIKRSRLLGAALRHLFAYLGGEDCDPESGLLHLYHASCCLMFASELHYSRPDLDDRYKTAPPKAVETPEEAKKQEYGVVMCDEEECAPHNLTLYPLAGRVLARCPHGALKAI